MFCWLYSLPISGKISNSKPHENIRWFSDVFMEYRSGTLPSNGLRLSKILTPGNKILG